MGLWPTLAFRVRAVSPLGTDFMSKHRTSEEGSYLLPMFGK